MFKKSLLVALLFVALFLVVGVVMAQEINTEPAAPTTVVTTEVAPVNVGNKVCPASGEKIKELGKDTVEYEGKVYNLCCPMCKDKFLADPAKYTAIVDKELAEEKLETPAQEKAEGAKI